MKKILFLIMFVVFVCFFVSKPATSEENNLQQAIDQAFLEVEGAMNPQPAFEEAILLENRLNENAPEELLAQSDNLEEQQIFLPQNNNETPIEDVEIIQENLLPSENFSPQISVPPVKKPIILDVLNFKNVEISDVLKLISERSGLNIVAGRNVTGQITLYLKNVEVFDVLRIILEANDLAYVEQNGMVRVMTQAEYEQAYGVKFNENIKTQIVSLNFITASEIAPVLMQMKSNAGRVIVDDKSNTLILQDSPEKIAAMIQLIPTVDVLRQAEMIDLSYSKADEVAEKIAGILTPNGGIVKSDIRSNRIIIYDTREKINAVKEVVKAFDVKEKEVLIEAKILQVVLSDETKFGINWETVINDYHDLSFTSQFDILSSGDKKGRVGIGTLSTDGYTAFLEALTAVGNTTILSNPHIITVNNKEARILVGSTEPYVTTTTTITSSGPATNAESVNFIEVGIKLYVTPTIHDDDFITMKIKPEVSSVTRSLRTTNNNTIPIVETSEAETTVSVKDGVSIIIGGLIKDENIENISKVPFLGDVPLLKYLFRNKSKSLRKTELVILLTPKIVSGDKLEEVETIPDVKPEDFR